MTFFTLSNPGLTCYCSSNTFTLGFISGLLVSAVLLPCYVCIVINISVLESDNIKLFPH